MTGAVTACSPEPVPGSKQAHEDEELHDDEAAVVQESNMRAVWGSAAVREGRAASLSPQPSSVRVSEVTPQYPASLPEAARRHSEDNPGGFWFVLESLEKTPWACWRSILLSLPLPRSHCLSQEDGPVASAHKLASCLCMCCCASCATW